MKKPASDTVRVGILGTGAIAHKMAQSLEHASLCSLTAIGSRDLKKSRDFANTYEGSSAFGGHSPHVWGSYAELVQDPEVDLIYIASPHPLHCEHTLLALNAGKHVLVEKPFALQSDQAEIMIKLAQKKQLFLMEAMWTRYIPAVRRTRELLRDGAIGQLLAIQAGLGFSFPFNPESRIYNPALGGGAMLDLGIYPLSLASYFAGVPVKVESVSTLTQTGVDASDSFCAEHAQGVVSSLFCTVNACNTNSATLCGSSGSIQLGPLFINANKLILSQQGPKGENVQEILLPFPGPGYHFEADEAAFCIRSGLTESPDMPLEESLALCKIMDNILDNAGVHYHS